jgi:hypothetical protein
MSEQLLTRQQVRALKRVGAKMFMQANYPKATRKVKREIASELAKRKVAPVPVHKNPD